MAIDASSPPTRPSDPAVRVPTRASVRAVLGKAAACDADLRALCIDYLPELVPALGSGMSYEAIVNVLLERVAAEDLLSAIKQCFPERFTQNQHIIQYVDLASVPPVSGSGEEGNAERPTVPPPRSAYDPAWYAARPAEEQLALEALHFPGAAVTLLAPEAFGKTWLLNHIIRRVETRGRIVNLNLRAFGTSEIMSSYSRFLRELARQLLIESTGETAEAVSLAVDEAWRYADNPIDNLNSLMERRVLPRFSRGEWLILALDGIDAMGRHPYLEDFFTLLRGWMEDAARPPWSALRLMLTLSMAPRLLVSNIHQSPFNVATNIELSDLEPLQVQRLAEMYRLRWTAEQLKALTDLVGGHPYLLRLVMHEARRTGKSVEELTASPCKVLGDYLLHCARWLSSSPGLRDAFVQVLANPRASLSFDVADRLCQAGYLLWDERTHEYRPRYNLYRRMFQTTGT